LNCKTCGHYHKFTARATVIHETLTLLLLPDQISGALSAGSFGFSKFDRAN
jgi:hypothetical protein